MAESKPKKSTAASAKPKVFDVAHPSKNVAPATSKPVIVGHTSQIKADPMVSPVEASAESAEPESTEKKIPVSSKALKRELVINPIAVDTEPKEEGVKESFDLPSDAPAEEAVEVSPEANPEESSEVVQETETAEAESTDIAPEVTEISDEATDEASENSDDSAVDAIVAGVNTKKDRKDQEEKEAKQAEEIQGLIASKKYNVKTHLPPGKRNMRWLIVLVVIAILGGAAWYYGVGPGKDLWNKVPGSQPTVQAPAAKEDKKQETKKEETTNKVETATFNNPAYGLSFTYPKSWKVETAKDSEFPTRDIITLTSGVENIKSSPNGTEQVEVEAFLRTKIFVENTVNPIEYASDLVSLTSCSSEDVLVAGQTLRFIYSDGTGVTPTTSMVSLSPDNCTPTANQTFSANDQVQFPAKKNTYIIYTEYVLSEAHLKKNGLSTAEEISVAQQSGVVTSKDIFKAGKNYLQFQESIKSIKEL